MFGFTRRGSHGWKSFVPLSRIVEARVGFVEAHAKVVEVRVGGGCIFSPGGRAEISRWRKPPDFARNTQRAPEGPWNSAALSGLTFLIGSFRWLAPPANFRGASGTDGRGPTTC